MAILSAVAGLCLAGLAGPAVLQLRRGATRPVGSAVLGQPLDARQPRLPGAADPLELAGDVAEPAAQRAVDELAALLLATRPGRPR